jgi:hypothetical protein
MFEKRMIAAALLAISMAGLPSAGLAQACVSRAESRQLLEQGQVTPLPEALRQAGLEDGRVVDAQLCRAGGGFVYRVRILQNGQVRGTNVPAG